MSDLIDREELKKKKVYSNERREYVVPVAEIDWMKPAVVAKNATGDTIYRQAANDALWKALHNYEDKTEKQFRESDDLDVSDWIEHRIFVQNMNDIDRQIIAQLPPAEQRTGRLYRHYKGGIYEVIAEAVHTETEESFIIYKDSAGLVWARPWEMFYGNLPDGRRRFEPIDGARMIEQESENETDNRKEEV